MGKRLFPYSILEMIKWTTKSFLQNNIWMKHKNTMIHIHLRMNLFQIQIVRGEDYLDENHLMPYRSTPLHRADFSKLIKPRPV